MKAFKPFFVAALAVAIGMSAHNMQAQKTTSSTDTNGQASSGASITSGNDQTGGWSNGGSNGTYNAAGRDFSAGGANSATQAKSTFSAGPNKASSFSVGSTTSSAFALGAPKNTNTDINGSDGQATYAGLSTDSMNGVSAGNTTGGSYEAKGKGTSELAGAVHTIGDTQVTANQGPTSASTSLKTFGASDTTVSGFQKPGVEECNRNASVPNSSVQVAGNGGGNGQSFLSNGGNYAGASNVANMSYTATGTTGAAGGMGAVGSTNASLTSNSASSSSNMTSFSAAHGH